MTDFGRYLRRIPKAHRSSVSQFLNHYNTKLCGIGKIDDHDKNPQVTYMFTRFPGRYFTILQLSNMLDGKKEEQPASFHIPFYFEVGDADLQRQIKAIQKKEVKFTGMVDQYHAQQRACQELDDEINQLKVGIHHAVCEKVAGEDSEKYPMGFEYMVTDDGRVFAKPVDPTTMQDMPGMIAASQLSPQAVVAILKQLGIDPGQFDFSD